MSTNNDTQIMFRGVGPIKTPDGETFAEYIRRALISELKIVCAYADDAPLQLSGWLNNADFSSNSVTSQGIRRRVVSPVCTFRCLSGDPVQLYSSTLLFRQGLPRGIPHCSHFAAEA